MRRTISPEHRDLRGRAGHRPLLRSRGGIAMKNRLLVMVLVAVALVGLVLPGTAEAADVLLLKGGSAEAFFSSTDPSGCISTFVFLVANDENPQSPPDPGSASSHAAVTISQRNECTDTVLLGATGLAELADPDFQVIGPLTSATLDTTIVVFDFVSSSSFSVDVAMTWTGTGDVNRENITDHFELPGLIVNSHFNGAHRLADASGVVTNGVNFTPNPSFRAEINSLIAGSVFIEHTVGIE